MTTASPDLYSLDYFIWEHLKGKVYFERPANLQGDLSEKVLMNARLINEESISKVVNKFYNRLELCQLFLGHHLEHL